MTKFLLSGLACAGLLLAIPDTALAHGGQYRGPGDVVPPNPGGGGGRSPGPSGPSTPGPSGPSTPGPSGPSTPGPAGPATGGPAGPSGGGGPTTGAGGMDVGDDLTRWQFWWEFNKDPFINLKAAVHATGTVTYSDDFFMGAGKVLEAKDTMKPTDAQIMNQVLPKLKQALDSTDQRDITSSCMVAMAKIGKNHKDFNILDVFRARLKSPDQEIRETAAVAMGISQMTEAVDDLIALATDSEQGRKLAGRNEVDDRQRSFAAYGLGLVGYATTNIGVKRKALDAMKGILADKTISDRNIRVAAINAIGLLQPTDDDEGRQLLKDCSSVLETYWNEKLGAGEQLIQAHVPPAIAKLLESCSDDALEAHFKEEFLKELLGKGDQKRVADQIPQSCVVALGRMAEPNEKGSKDAKISEALVQYFEKGKDKQATYFSLMALAMIGGDENRNELIKALEKGSKALEKPWAALSLGIYSFRAIENGATPDPLIGRSLLSWLDKVKNPEVQAAIAIALGLGQNLDSADQLRALLEENKNKDELAGYLCVALALMNDQRSTEIIKNLVETSVRRPARLQQAAIALGKLGDKEAATLLARMLTEDKQPNLAKMSAIASALGYIGDRRTIDPLLKMLFDESLTELSRAFAAVALGGVADKEPLRWNSKVGTNMNYRAAVETLTNGQTGILDIL